MNSILFPYYSTASKITLNLPFLIFFQKKVTNENVYTKRCETSTHLQGQDVLIDRVEGNHGNGPLYEPSDISARLLRRFVRVQRIIQIGLHQVQRLSVDVVLGKFLQIVEEARVGQYLRRPNVRMTK